jgi:LacI family transcriptional regulator
MARIGEPTSPRGASVKDVAAAAGVSLGTVSNVLNRPELVSAATRARVEAAMGSLGFVRNDAARQLRAGKSRALAYVMLDATNPFFTDVAQGIELAAEAAGLSLFLCNSDNRDARERMHLARLEEQRVQGVLLTPVDPASDAVANLARRGTPIVIVDRTRDDEQMCSVAVDDVLGGRLAVEHLVERGHRRIAFVGGPMALGQVRDRLQGARQAWADAGLPRDALVHVETTGLTVAEGKASGERLSGLSAKRRPTAAFCANDLVALGLLQQSIGSGRHVPSDLAIVGYDDIEFAAAAAVPLSSIRQPRQELGRMATALLLEEAGGGEHSHRQVLYQPELIARASTGS